MKNLQRKEKIYEVWEGGKGFGIRINPGGRKTWQYVYRAIIGVGAGIVTFQPELVRHATTHGLTPLIPDYR